MVGRINRLKKRKEFNYIYRKGEVAHAPSFMVHYVKTYLPYPKIGIIVSKQVGNSVVRSRVKRIISEAFRLNLDQIATKNYVITARASAVDKSSNDIAREILSTFSKKGLLRPRSASEKDSSISAEHKASKENKPTTLNQSDDRKGN